MHKSQILRTYPAGWERILRDYWWLLVVSAAIVTAIYARPPIPIDETRYLSVAWEMWQTGDFLVPHINGVPYSHKPPLLFWLIQLSWSIFGVNELTARLVGPASSLLCFFLGRRLAKKLWPDHSEIATAVPFVMAGMLIWTVFLSLTMFDALLTVWVLLCLLAVVEARQHQSRRGYWLLFGVALGLGILAKGPVILLYVIPIVLLAPIWAKHAEHAEMWWRTWYGNSLLGLIIGVAIALCWAIPAAISGGAEYREAIFLHQTAGRMVHAFAHDRPFYWYLLMSPLLLFPWFFIPQTWPSLRIMQFDSGARFCLCVVVPAFLLLSLVSGKQLHYTLPILPIVALLIASKMAGPNHTGSTADTVGRPKILLITMMLLAAALLALPLLDSNGGDREILNRLPAWLPVIPLLSMTPLLLRQPQGLQTIQRVTLSMLILFVMLHLGLRQPLQQTYSQHAVGAALSHIDRRGLPLAIYPASLKDQFQFAGRLHHPVQPLDSPDELRTWADQHPDGYYLLFTSARSAPADVAALSSAPYKNGRLMLCPATRSNIGTNSLTSR